MTRKLLLCSLAIAALSCNFAHAKTSSSTTINGGGSSLAAPSYIAEFEALTAAKAGDRFSYAAVGSGSGQTAFLTNNLSLYASPPAGTLTYGTITGNQVDFGASDAFLTASQLTNPATGSYSLSGSDGPVIQVPTFGVPVTMAYNESGISNDSLTLTDAQVCGILSGAITDWNTVSPGIPAGTPITVVYRSDGSGTTFLTMQHLNAVCNSNNSNFPETGGVPPVTKNFVAATGGVFTPSNVPSNFVAESGSLNVANTLVSTANSIGYLSPDFTSIAPKSANTTSLQVAGLVNAHDGRTYLPTVQNTVAGLAAAGAGSTNASPPKNMSDAMNPLNWVPAIPVDTKGYPIVGYTTVLASTCYASQARGKLVNLFLTDLYGKYKTSIVEANGFSPLANTAASKYVTSIKNVFLTNTSGYDLDIDDATTCAGLPGR
jgi:ABC-type phosphate transport system substrate-binding protein